MYLTSSKGLLYQEQNGPAPRRATKPAGQTEAAASVTAGKTLKISNDPWAFRGKPIEIEIAEGNDTRDELVSFLDHVARQDPATIADARVALADCATVLIANQSAETGGWVDFPTRLLTINEPTCFASGDHYHASPRFSLDCRRRTGLLAVRARRPAGIGRRPRMRGQRRHVRPTTFGPNWPASRRRAICRCRRPSAT